MHLAAFYVRQRLLPVTQKFCAALQTLIELQLIFGGFHGGKLGSDVLLSLNLINQGLKWVTDSYNVQQRRKCLTIRHRTYKPKRSAQSVHDICICGKLLVMRFCHFT